MMCGQIGADYCDYWSAGKVANLHGYADVYNLQLIEQVERSILPSTSDPSRTAVVPFPYLPVFVLPFQFLSFITPEIGFWIWSVINFLTLILYLRYFTRNLNLPPPSIRLGLLLLVSLPVYLNFFSGQVGIWMAICMGEFMRACIHKKFFRAGLWLGGLLIKPQMLVLIGLVLLLQRSAKVLAGLATSSLFLVILSTLLSGPAGLVQMFKLWTIYANGQASNWVAGMMNWRMLGFHLSALIYPQTAWGIVEIGMIAMVILTLWVWRRPFAQNLKSFPVSVLGLLTATTMTAWHSHIHTAMILIPPMIYLYQAKSLPQKVLDYWAFLPAFIFLFVVFVPETMIKINVLTDLGNFLYFPIGASEFAVNFYLFWWAVSTSRQTS